METMLIFRSSKLRRKKYVRAREFFDHQNYMENVRGNNVDFSNIKTTARKVQGKKVEVRQNLVFNAST